MRIFHQADNAGQAARIANAVVSLRNENDEVIAEYRLGEGGAEFTISAKDFTLNEVDLEVDLKAEYDLARVVLRNQWVSNGATVSFLDAVRNNVGSVSIGDASNQVSFTINFKHPMPNPYEDFFVEYENVKYTLTNEFPFNETCVDDEIGLVSMLSA